MTDLPEGFLPHDGGPCPVPGDTHVVVLHKSGIRSDTYIDQYDGVDCASCWGWSHLGHPGDIIAYRPTPKQEG